MRSRLSVLHLVVVALFVTIVAANAWVLHGYKWASTSTTLHLQLNRPAVAWQDGSTSWNSSAAEALRTWNSALQGAFELVEGGPITGSGGDGVNQVFFSNTMYDEKFGTNVLAVTLNYSAEGSGTFTEADVIFNNNLQWNSYRGALQSNSKGPIHDLQRVALHEFGHVLGLGHPDESGQSVWALMNSTTSELDTITNDDIEGALSIYGIRITSSSNPPPGEVGTPFSYQITANPSPWSYSAVDLPPGLQVNSGNGLISGSPHQAGTYRSTVSVRGSGGRSASAVVEFRIEPGPPDPALAASLNLDVNRMAVDALRSRIYATQRSGSVAVIDTKTLTVVETIQIGSEPSGLAISADGSKLWVACNGPSEGIGVIDLNSLTRLPSLRLPSSASDIEEGLDNRLYVTSPSSSATIMQVDAVSGLWDWIPSSSAADRGFLEISPDRKTLYLGGGIQSPVAVETYDVSGRTAVPLQRRSFDRSSANALCLSPNGRFLAFPSFYGNVSAGFESRTIIMDAANLNSAKGVIPAGQMYSFDTAAFSGDSGVMYLAGRENLEHAELEIYETGTFTSIGSINLRLRRDSRETVLYVGDMVVDPTGAHIFVKINATHRSPAELRVYRTGRRNQLSGVPVSKKLANLSTRLHAGRGDQSLIGGFIVNGTEDKHLVIRALGPSLPIINRLIDPTLQVRDAAGALVASNDDWKAAAESVQRTGLAPSHDLESAVAVSLPTGSYTAIVGDAAGSVGIGLVEVYDVTPEVNSGLVNISTRGEVGAGENVMIGGVIVRGDQLAKVVVRAIGPSLAAAGIPNALSDPAVEIINGDGMVIARNDNWRSHQQQELIGTGIPPGDDREAAVLLSLSPAPHTAVVRGQDGGTGVGLVEIYSLD